MSAADATALQLSATPMKLSNPMSEDESLMRTSLLPGLLRAAARNVSHRAPSVALFEIARVYEDVGEQLPQEAGMVAAVFSGSRVPQSWNSDARDWDFFSVKGVFDTLYRSLGLEPPRFIAAGGGPFHPTRGASLVQGPGPVGAFGELHPTLCGDLGVPEGTVIFEVSFASLFSRLSDRVTARDVPRLPATYIDLAVVVGSDIPAERVDEVVRKAGAPEVTAARLFDLYEGGQVGAGKKSLAFSLELRHPEKTITDEEALVVRDRIVSALAERVGAELRS